MTYTKALVLTLAFALSACAGYDASLAGADGETPGQPDLSGAPKAGDSALYDHDVVAARNAYAESKHSDPTGRAQAGFAITSTLALPMSAEFSSLLKNHLGATRDVDNALLYGEGGLLYLVARGVPWEDGDSLAGIRTVLANTLPWERARLESLDGFVAGLNQPVDLLTETLVDLAKGPIADIRASNLEVIENPDFDEFVLPGEVFFDEALEIEFGKSEIALLDAALAAAQAVIYFADAYQNAWTLERALGTSVWDEVVTDPMHPLHVDGFTVEDYQVSHLNQNLFRAFDARERLVDAQEALGDVFGSIANSIELGIAADGQETTLAWSVVDASFASDVASFFRAFEKSVYEEAVIPFTEPPMSVNLAPLFTDGRTLDPELNLFVREVYTDEFGEYSEVVMSDDAINAMADGLFQPPLDSEMPSELTIAEQIDVFIQDVTGAYFDEVDRAYSTSF